MQRLHTPAPHPRSGPRRSESLALRSEDVDLLATTVTVRPSTDRVRGRWVRHPHGEVIRVPVGGCTRSVPTAACGALAVVLVPDALDTRDPSLYGYSAVARVAITDAEALGGSATRSRRRA